MRSAEAMVREGVDGEAGVSVAATTAPASPSSVRDLPPDPLADTWLEHLPEEEPDWGSLGWAPGAWVGPEPFVDVDVDVNEQERARFDLSGAPMADAEVWPPEGMLDVTAPGPLLAGLVNQVDLDEAGDEQLVEVLAAAARLQSWASAVEIDATARLVERVGDWRGVTPAGRPRAAVGEVTARQMAVAEVRAALAVSTRSAQIRVETAQELSRLPGTQEALRAGRIDLPKARVIADATATLDQSGARAVETAVLARAEGRTSSQLRDTARRAALAFDPAAGQVRHQRAVADRAVHLEPLADGMACCSYADSADKVSAFYRWVTAKARASKGPGDARTLAQCRADVLGDIGTDGLAFDRLPSGQGRRPQIQVVVSAATLLGVDDAPGELVGIGPITAEVARRIAAEGTWRRLLTDPRTGRFDELSVDTYEPPQDLRDHVTARDRTCRGLGCRIPAEHCDLDHRVPHPRGPTSAHNLDPDCRVDHEIKTFTDTTVEPDGHGGLWITLPSGRRYHRPAEPVLEEFDADTTDGETPDGAGEDPLAQAGEEASAAASPDIGADRAGPDDADDDMPPF
ncbi:MAG: hypothetical protein QOJ60_227 [Actinomycetota bacterium]|nr:hypothetical protein [Actinomycetota bacterium]